MSKFYFKGNFIIGIFVKQIRTYSSLFYLNEKSYIEPVQKATEIKTDKAIIAKLEKLSLVEFDNDNGIHKLESAVHFAQKLKDFKIDRSVQPMYSIFETEKLVLREDKVSETNSQNNILNNAKIVEDEYFISPPDNLTSNC